MICWFDDVLLILIHGFAWFQVDLASPQVFPSFIHEISSILTPKSPFSAQNRVPKLKSHVDPDPPDDRRFTGRPDPHEAPDDRNHLYSKNYRISGLFRTSGTPRFWLRLIFVLVITNSYELRFGRSLARFEALDIPHTRKIPPYSFDSIIFCGFWHLCLGLPPYHPQNHHRLPQPNKFCSHSICGCLSSDLSLLRCLGYLGTIASSSTTTTTSA